MDRKKSLLFALAMVVVVAALCANLANDWRETREIPAKTALVLPFEIAAYSRTVAPSGLTCEEATGATYGFLTYDTVRMALARSSIPASTPYANCYLDTAAMIADPEVALTQLLSQAFDPDVFYAFLEKEFTMTLNNVAEKGNRRSGNLAWGSGQLGAGALTAFQRTGQRRFVKLYALHFSRIMQLRDSEIGYFDTFHNRLMDAWGSTNLGENAGQSGTWVAHVTHFSVIMAPATGFAREILANPNLAEFLPFANDVVTFFDTAFTQFDVDLRQVEGTNEFWHWRPLVEKYEATNHIHLQGEALLNMFAITKDAGYRARIVEILRVFEHGAIVDDYGFAAWNYFPYFQVPEQMDSRNARQYSEFIWKAALTIPFIYAAHRDGFEVNQDLIAAMNKTIMEHVLANNGVARNFHPKGSVPIEDREIRLNSNGPADSIYGMLSAAHEVPDVSDRVRTIVSTRPDLFPDGWLGSIKLARGYAHYLQP